MQTMLQAEQAAGRSRSMYRVTNHAEAGVFDSMTGATLWALRNLRGREWEIEPVVGGTRPINLGTKEKTRQISPSEN